MYIRCITRSTHWLLSVFTEKWDLIPIPQMPFYQRHKLLLYFAPLSNAQYYPEESTIIPSCLFIKVAPS